MKTDKKIMILGGSELQIPAIKSANEMGIHTVVLDYDPNALGRKFASKFYEISTLDFEKVLEVAIKENIDGILTICSDRPMPIIAKIGEKLRLNTISYDTALKATDKGLMRKALLEYNVPIPQFFVCKTIDDAKNAVASIDGKCIFKPSNNSGSRGIILYEENNDIEATYYYAKQFSTNNTVVIEEYMEGPEVSVEVFVINHDVNIIQITDKITTGAPYFVEMGHTQPSSLSKDIQEQISKVTSMGCLAVGITDGPAHVEIKITDQGPKIVEIGARLGGDHITTDLVPLSTGVDMVSLAIKSALNMPLKIKKKYEKSSAIRYIGSKLAIPEQIKNEVIYYFDENNQKDEIKSSNDRKGYYIVQSENLINLNKMLSSIKSFNERS